MSPFGVEVFRYMPTLRFFWAREENIEKSTEKSPSTFFIFMQIARENKNMFLR